jgi:hypothetical protein
VSDQSGQRTAKRPTYFAVQSSTVLMLERSPIGRGLSRRRRPTGQHSFRHKGGSRVGLVGIQGQPRWQRRRIQPTHPSRHPHLLSSDVSMSLSKSLPCDALTDKEFGAGNLAASRGEKKRWVCLLGLRCEI